MDNANETSGGFPAADIFQWWEEMQPDQQGDGPNRRGELAELRRCKTLAEVLLVPRFQVLRWKLQAAGYRYMPACAAVAGILAHVETNNTEHVFAEWLARPKAEGTGSPRLSDLRFRRLMRAKSHDELFIDLIRVLPLAADTAPVKQLAEDIYRWNEYTRRKWTFAYYDAQAEGE
jgi:CRISPR system Cascade subunit CasB